MGSVEASGPGTPNEAIAIDGPAASGKSTVARRVAAELGYLYVDSGAFYRALTWEALRTGVGAGDADGLSAMAAAADLQLFVRDGTVRFRINGAEPCHELRSREVTENVSPVAAVPGVRAAVVAWLRQTRALGPVVMEGRDIGTVVFPDTRGKFYLDADPAERARRRHRDTGDPAGRAGVEAVDAALRRRDAIDSGRASAPLRVAEGAEVIDSTGMSVDEVTQRIVRTIRGGGAARIRRK